MNEFDLSAAFSGVSGGLIRGFTDMAKGYSFWDGRSTSRFVIGTASGENVVKQAKNCNSSLAADSNDDILKDKFLKNFNITEGDIGIEKITTKTESMGMTADGVYVDKGASVAGYIDRYTTGKSRVHISPRYTLGDVVDFRAVAGHELNHVYHNYYFKGAYVKNFSETVAYKYTTRVYQNVGRY